MASLPDAGSRQDGLYAEAAAMYGAALERLARAYEPDADRRLDLLQEVHVALWRSFASYDGRCSVRTWVYRVAHNVAISQVIRRSRAPALVGLDELESRPDAVDPEQVLDDRLALDRLMTLIHGLDPFDRQVKAQRLERAVARRNLREYVAAVFVVVFCGWGMWVGPSATIRIGAGLIVAAAIAVAYMLHLWGAARTLPSGLALIGALEFHRVQFEKQRDLLRSVWLWYLLPFAPGLLVLQIGQALAHPERISRIISAGAVMIILAVGIYELNRRAAARIQRRIDRLKEN